ncbi:uncharacterized protein DSM5745_05223 [Aspergillus mulundensis]|uniref:Uncharacterized protein n=1 Tax=Aspergillus mulundensis TaxID=1810919 RepID=A0A3D8S5Y2_9EURO|nr:Uncharacterized protein DSM5745_05223 [Aspergillus mulundensis]RDW81666.1 Uncharacterized protein DSM5745_05223 [Aspergillus mulundensis]
MREEASTSVQEPGEPSSEAGVGAERERSETTSTNGSQPRYYRSLDIGVRQGPDAEPEAPTLIADTLDGPEPLEMARLEALQTLDACRHVITSLELTRLRKSRSGLYNWMAFWERLYKRSFASMLSARVMDALVKVDVLFRTVAYDLHQLAQKTELAIVSASSEKEIIHVLQRMEDEVNARRRRRRRKAKRILEKMRVNIEAIPVKVSDELCDDMKRGVFALDVYCDYHPGDESAERAERMWSQHFISQPIGLVAVSPFLYRQWRETMLVDIPPLPLTAYHSNTPRPQCPQRSVSRAWTDEVNAEDSGWPLRPASA